MQCGYFFLKREAVLIPAERSDTLAGVGVGVGGVGLVEETR